MTDFGEHIRGWRMVLGLTAQQVTEHTGIARDTWDAMAWETTTLDLLEQADIRTPQRRLTRAGWGNVLILGDST